MSLSQDILLSIGETVKIMITGLRNPCKQLNLIKDGLMKAVLGKDEEENLIRKDGVILF